MEALTLHEAVPGHHLQYALAQEIEGLPEWRKWDVYTAFAEGWALYAESLGVEIGLYDDPYSKFGQLTYEMWRAIRLVVDTGMHARGWTRQQAIDYLTANRRQGRARDRGRGRPLSSSSPADAPAYKIGELKIRELRAYAQKELGPRFDLRAFHDRLLGDGPLPLDLLEKNVKALGEGTAAAAVIEGPPFRPPFSRRAENRSSANCLSAEPGAQSCSEIVPGADSLSAVSTATTSMSLEPKSPSMSRAVVWPTTTPPQLTVDVHVISDARLRGDDHPSGLPGHDEVPAVACPP